MVWWFCALDRSVDGCNSLSELGRERSSLKCVKSFVELLHIGNSKDRPITVLSIQDTMERSPSQGSRMSADTMFLGHFSNNGGGLEGGLTIKGSVQLPDRILGYC